MTVRQKLHLKTLRLRDTLSRLCERIIPPGRYIEYAGAEWSGSLSFFASADPIFVDLSPAGIKSERLYAPEANGSRVFFENRPDPMEAAEPADIADMERMRTRPLVFEHLCLSTSEVAEDQDWNRQDLQRRFQFYSASALMLGQAQPVEARSAVGSFLTRYTAINRDHAWYLQPTYVGVHLPYRAWPFCIWIDRVDTSARHRLFTQAVTHEGYPLGVTQSWPVNSRGWRMADLERLDDSHTEGAA